MSNNLFSWFQLTLSGLGVLGLFLLFFAIIALIVLKKNKLNNNVKINIKNINENFKANKEKILNEILTSEELKAIEKKEKEENKAKKKTDKKSPITEKPKRIFVLDFNGDVAASAVTAFREQVTALLQAARPIDEIIVRLESPGGMVHSYGLASSQLARIREHNIPLTICVDKVAASGGYMMACLADKIIAAPFAIIGSIGVVASLPNLNKLLRKNDIDYLEMTAGEYKRTVTPLGEITEKGKAKFQEQLEDTHELFKNHIKKYRASLDMSVVATGEYWYGTQALELNLVDEIKTSDDYLLEASQKYDIFHIFTPKKESFKDKLTGTAAALISLLIDKNLSKSQQKYPLLM
ncbi:protease SohB [Fluviispira multicolorata]|uniref:Protease SohB n=1 Tax=Fluviispira multicolorata TaxID=2654512 RepID=A0A833N4E0_9BACT|nr:protease SohB [Fluviispira multicolorata]KAB8031926.1 protease SohB [Fluviispira multicolorata]